MRSFSLLVLVSYAAFAEPLAVKRQFTPAKLKFDARVDVPVGLLIGTTGASLVAFRPWLATSPCRSSCTAQEVPGLDLVTIAPHMYSLALFSLMPAKLKFRGVL